MESTSLFSMAINPNAKFSSYGKEKLRTACIEIALGILLILGALALASVVKEYRDLPKVLKIPNHELDSYLVLSVFMGCSGVFIIAYNVIKIFSKMSVAERTKCTQSLLGLAFDNI